MADAIAFDTHRFVKRLTESGFTEKQAETLAEEHVALLNANLATKADIAAVQADIAAAQADVAAVQQDVAAVKADVAAVQVDVAKVEAGMDALRQETKAGIEAVRYETKAAIEAVKADLVRWLCGAPIAQGGLIVALVKLL